MSTTKQDMMRLLESLPDDVSLADIHAHIEAARDQFDCRLSSDGITRFYGESSELDGKVLGPGALQIAQWEGLELSWSCDPFEDILSLHLIKGERESAPLLKIPLSSGEAQSLRDCLEEGGWGYYELKVLETDDRGAVNVSFRTAEQEITCMTWFLDKKRRAALTRAINRFYASPLLSQ
jgi:hypothetical protein